MTSYFKTNSTTTSSSITVDTLFRANSHTYYGGPDPDLPRLVGEGPPTCSTSLSLMVPPQPIVWDTNGYYAALGVDPWATREELRRAYQEHGGSESARMTYCLKKLLDPDVRHVYDRTPLGSVYWDEVFEEEQRRELLLDIARERARLDMNEDEAFHFLQAQGLTGPFLHPDDVALDNRAPRGDDVSPSEKPWGFSYYLWRTEGQDLTRLREWQGLLIAIIGARKDQEPLQIAVGYSGGHDLPPWQVIRVGFRLVCYLRDGVRPTRSLATAAAMQVLAEQ